MKGKRFFSGFGHYALIISFGGTLALSCVEAKPKVEHNILEEPKKETPMKESKKIIPAYINTEYILGKFDPSTHKMFSKIDSKYADTNNRHMHTEAYEAFIKMHSAAMDADIHLLIKSAARNFTYQKSIWDRKWNGTTLLEGKINAATEINNDVDRVKAIMKYSSMPGTSRHHWGTDIDLNNFNNSYFKEGKGMKEYEWLQRHANDFGFFQTYTDKKNGRSGYEEERWHWSFLPIAALCLEKVQTSVNNEQISGFDGCTVAPIIDVKKNYILGIDKKCLNYVTN